MQKHLACARYRKGPLLARLTCLINGKADMGVRSVVAFRIIVSYFAPLLIAGLIYFQQVGMTLIFVSGGVVLTWKLFVIGLIIAITFASSVARHPAIWSAATAAVMIVASYTLLPSDEHLWRTLSPMAAFFAVASCVLFCLWNVIYPIGRTSTD